MVKEPVRGSSLKFSLTSNEIDPLPVPIIPELIIIQESLLTAVQLQAGPAVTSTDPVPPAAVTGNVNDESDKEHGTALNLKNATAIS